MCWTKVRTHSQGRSQRVPSGDALGCPEEVKDESAYAFPGVPSEGPEWKCVRTLGGAPGGYPQEVQGKSAYGLSGILTEGSLRGSGPVPLEVLVGRARPVLVGGSCWYCSLNKLSEQGSFNKAR